ncbi:hypothetical protein GCM10027052_23650 [Parafrigoribacterium mesophilum]|uniref:hypothetical protein n=1 Tax=Parafrigoribacterium mesophilum TaxID=433646 RepID=UPI0031FD0A03
MTDASDGPIDETEVSIRRAPRYGRFLLAGAALGVIAALVATSVVPVDPNVGFSAMFGYLLLYGVPVGLGLGAATGVLLDRRASARAGTVIAGKMTVHASAGEQNPAARESGLQNHSELQQRSSDGEAQPESDDGQS